MCFCLQMSACLRIKDCCFPQPYPPQGCAKLPWWWASPSYAYQASAVTGSATATAPPPTIPDRAGASFQLVLCLPSHWLQGSGVQGWHRLLVSFLILSSSTFPNYYILEDQLIITHFQQHLLMCALIFHHLSIFTVICTVTRVLYSKNKSLCPC